MKLLICWSYFCCRGVWLSGVAVWANLRSTSAQMNCVCQFATKLVAMATSLKLLEKEGRINHLQCDTYRNGVNIVKFSPSNPEISWLWAKTSEAIFDNLMWKLVTIVMSLERWKNVRLIIFKVYFFMWTRICTLNMYEYQMIFFTTF